MSDLASPSSNAFDIWIMSGFSCSVSHVTRVSISSDIAPSFPFNMAIVISSRPAALVDSDFLAAKRNIAGESKSFMSHAGAFFRNGNLYLRYMLTAPKKIGVSFSWIFSSLKIGRYIGAVKTSCPCFRNSIISAASRKQFWQ